MGRVDLGAELVVGPSCLGAELTGAKLVWRRVDWKHTCTHFPSKPFVSPYTLYDGKLENNSSFPRCCGRVNLHKYRDYSGGDTFCRMCGGCDEDVTYSRHTLHILGTESFVCAE